MADSYFPLDIKSVKMLGMEKWRKGFFWPLPYETFIDIESEFREFLNQFIEKNSNNYISDLLLINYKLVIEYANFLYSLKVLKEIEKRGLRPIYSDESISFKGIIERGVPTERLLQVTLLQRYNIISVLKEQIRLIKGIFQLNKSVISLIRSIFHLTPFVVYYRGLTPLFREYAAGIKEGVILKGTHSWLPPLYDRELYASQQKSLNGLIKEILNGIENIAVHNNIVLTKIQLIYLNNITSEQLVNTAVDLKVLERRISRSKPFQLITGGSGKHFTRMLCAAVRNHDGTVTVFGQGEPAVYLWDETAWMQLSMVDKFYVYTNSIARCLKRTIKTFPPLKNNRVEIIGAETKIFYDLWHKESKKPVPSKVKRVMIIANIFKKDNEMLLYVPWPALVHYDLVMSIIEILRKGGYEILYKRHPGAVSGGQSGMSFGADVKIIDGRFEDVTNLADAFIFYYTMTTTFGYALCTNKPILLIDGKWQNWFPDMWELLEKRCRVIPTEFDDRNRVVINGERVLDALRQKPEKPNIEFLRTYMFPSFENKEAINA